MPKPIFDHHLPISPCFFSPSQLKMRAWRPPLTMSKQMSETKERFCGWPNLPHDLTFHAGPQPFGLAAHHTNGASKVSCISWGQGRPSSLSQLPVGFHFVCHMKGCFT